jgi:predicted ATPase
MFQNFVVKNFRCFSGLALTQLERVNLIAGKNNTGKTTLLEAIRLHCDPGNGGLLNEINKERGIENPLRAFEEVSSWLFWGRHLGMGAEVSSQDDKGIGRSLTIRLVDAITLRERFPDAQKVLREGFPAVMGQESGPFLILEYVGPNNETATTVGFSPSGLQSFSWTGTRQQWRLPTAFIRSGTPASARDVAFFGELELSKRQEEILPALQILEPRLQKLSLILLAGEPVIHGDLSGLPRLVPVPFMGEGTRRVLSILLAITSARGGVVLIDEIENGLHYSVLTQVWQAITKAARQNDVQVFATTHSYECINAAREALALDEPYDLALHRLDRVNGAIQAVRYDKDTIEYALEMSHEVR